MPKFSYDPSIFGIVLAGGSSTRMGVDKATLSWQGKTLLEHMISKLKAAGCTQIWVSGNRPGHLCITDPTPFAGPGRALQNLLPRLPNHASGALVVPVDMPLLPVAALTKLIEHPQGAYFSTLPLPAHFPNRPTFDSAHKPVGGPGDDLGDGPGDSPGDGPVDSPADSPVDSPTNGRLDSVYALHGELNTASLELPARWQPYMLNINTPKQWEQVLTVNMDEGSL